MMEVVDEECVEGSKGGGRVCRSLWFLPAAFFIVSIGGFLTTFTVGVSWKNISPFFPFISETGEKVPENFIFAFVMNSCAFMGATIYLLRFLMLSQWAEKGPPTSGTWQGLFRIGNQFSLLCALIACFGVAMVGNIEESRSSNGHFIGVLFCFFGTLLYMWIHLLLDLIIPPISRQISNARRFVVFLATIGFGVGIATVGRTLRLTSKYTIEMVGHEDVIARGLCHDGNCHVISRSHPDHVVALTCIFFEWFTVCVFSLWMGTVSFEFRRFALPYPVFTLITSETPPSFQEKRGEDGEGSSEESTHMVHIRESELV